MEREMESECSPTDRVEKLLQKYKSRQAVRSSEKLTSQVSRELEAWVVVNDELQLHGYQPVLFSTAPSSSSALSSGSLVLDEAGSVSLRRNILRLMEEVRRKENIIQDLLNALRSSKGYQPELVTPSSKSDRPTRMASCDHMTPNMGPDPLLQKLQSQVARLEYENTKLRIDLQNRPELHDLRKSQRQVKELERELHQCKNLLSSEQVDQLQSHQQIKNICSLLHVRSEDIVPRLTDMVETLEATNRVEKQLSSVLHLIYHPSAPTSHHLEHSDPRPSDHQLWCELTWRHVVLTLQGWLGNLRGLQALSKVFVEVCERLDLTGSGGRGSKDCEDGLTLSSSDSSLSLSLSCGDMAALLRQWVLRETNVKPATTQALLAMVRHFQELFDVKKPEGVYPQMSRVYQQLQEARNVMKNLKLALSLDPSCPSHELVAAVECLTGSDGGQLLLHIHREFGIQEPALVLEKLRLCEEFFPAFQAVVAEIQEFLGVDSLSAITPALYSLQAGLSHKTRDSRH